MSATSTIGIKLSLDGASQAEASLRRVGTGMEQLSTSAASVRQALGGLGTALAGALSVREFVQAADAVTQLQNNLRLATGSAQAAGTAYQQLFEIAQRSRSNFTELGNTFASITRATESLGLSQRQVLALTENIGNAITVSGASAQASQAALIQLGQGLASGVLRGEELNSILEQTPRLAKALADGLGVSTGALRKLGQEGKLTAEDVVGALRSQQGVLAKEVESSVATVGQAFQVLQNSATAFVGTLDAASGSSSTFAQAIVANSQSLDNVGGAFRTFNTQATSTDTLATGIAVAFETVAVLGANVAFVVRGIATEVGGLAAQAAAVARLDFSQAVEIGRLMRADAAKARAEVDALSERILNSRQQAAQIAQRSTFAANDPRRTDAGTPAAGAFAAAGNAATKAKKEVDEFAAALDKVLAKDAGLSSDYDKTLAALFAGYQKGRIGAEAYASAVGKLIEQQPFVKAALDEQVQAAARANDLWDEQFAASEKARLANEEQIKTAREYLGQLEFETSLLGQNAEQRAVATAVRELESKGIKEGTQAYAAYIDKIKEAVRLREGKQAEVKAAEDAATAWRKAADQIEQSLTDALMRGFESGKGFAEVLRDTVANMFKTLVLRPVVQATVQGGLNAVGLGGASGGGGLLGTANNAYSAYSAITGMGGIASSAGIISGATYGTTALSSQSMMLAAQEAGFGAAGVGAAGNIGAVLSNPVTIGLGAVLAIAALSKATKGETRYGGQYGFNFGDGLADYRRGGNFAGATLGVNRITGAETLAEAEVQAAITGTVGGINALLKSAGSSAALVGFQAGLETSGKGRGGVFAGGTLSTGATFGESGQGDNYLGTLFEKTSTQSPDAQTALANFALDLQQATVQALQAATDIPESLKKLVQGVDAEALTADAAAALLNTVQAQISAVEKLNTAFASIGWESFTQGAYDATVALAEASGGFDALAQNLAGYYSNFYTEAEQRARATDTLATQLAALGQALPTTRDGFRALVESAEAAGNTTLLAGLLALQDEFAALVPAAEAASQAITQTAKAVADAAAKAATEARSAALAQLDASVQRERTLWQQQATAAASLRDEVRGVFDTLSTSISELRAEALGPTLSAAQGQAFISQAIAAVGAGAGLPDGTALASAISAARGGLSAPGAFANSAEQQFATLKLAGELAVLQEAAGDQLSTADRQLAAANDQIEQLDQTLAYWRTQLDDNQAAISATMSVAEAVNALRALMFPEQAASAAAAGTNAKPGFGGFTIGGGGSGASTVAAESLSRLGNVYYGALGTAITDAGYIDRFDSINAAINTLDWSDAGKAASVATLTQAAIDNDVTTREIAISAGLSLSDIEALLPDVPRYMVGTNFVPADGLAFLHKGEQVIPAPQGAPYQPPQGSADVVAELRALRTETAGLRAQVADMALHTQRTANATNGQPERPMLVETV